jgi:hypothetical protein
VTDAELQRRVERLEERLRKAGRRVTLDGCTDNCGMAELLQIKERALRERVKRAVNVPPHYNLGTTRWWPLDEFITWLAAAKVEGTINGTERRNAATGGI